jgi:hypothetical protein
MQQRSHFIVEREPGQATLNPEKELMLSVLEEAKNNLTNKKQSIRDDAYRWFTEQPTDWFFSFHSLCEQLDVDPGTVRRQIFKRVGIIGSAK